MDTTATSLAHVLTGLRGELRLPGTAGYDTSRAVFNGMIDRRPAAVVHCADADDVSLAVRAARRLDLEITVRGGGHGVAGNAVRDGALMLDLSGLTSLDVVDRRATAGAGLLLGEFDRATGAHGLATPLGVVSLTGIAGLTLGGGIGWLNGRHGLACDNLVAAEVVVADGDVVRVDEDHHGDLLWGLRGGGGNFGVVTSFSYRLHPVATVLAGGLSFPGTVLRETLRAYDEVAGTTPDELSTAAALGRGPDGGATMSVAACWCGDVDEGRDVLRRLTGIPGAVGEFGAMSYPDWQCVPDAGYPDGRRHYWKAGFLRALPDAAVDVLARLVPEMPSPYSGIGLQQMHGAAARVDPTATAFAHRADQYDFLLLSQWPSADDDARNVAWSRRVFDAMSPFLADAVYVNNLGEEGTDRVRSAYGPNYDRLVALKRAWDPDNVFRANQNVVPEPAP